jgi:hypothetical protein
MRHGVLEIDITNLAAAKLHHHQLEPFKKSGNSDTLPNKELLVSR